MKPYSFLMILSGNEAYLRELSASTLRKVGLCGDHFFPKSFRDNAKNMLKRNQNPIPYWNAAEEEKIEKRIEGEIQKRIEEETQEMIEKGTKNRMQEKTQKRIQEEILEIIEIREEEKGETGSEEREAANRETENVEDAEEIIEIMIEEKKGEIGSEEQETTNRENKTGENAIRIFAETPDNENEIHVNRGNMLKTYPAAAKKDRFI